MSHRFQIQKQGNGHRLLEIWATKSVTLQSEYESRFEISRFVKFTQATKRTAIVVMLLCA